MSEAPDVIIPIVFPDYKILVEVQGSRVDLVPWTRFDDFTIPSYREAWSDLGHAGVLLIRGSDGFTRYFEYGRYDRVGYVRSFPVPNAKIEEGTIAHLSLPKILNVISRRAGKSTRIQAAMVEEVGLFEKASRHAQNRLAQRLDPNRRPYNILSHNCITFVQSVLKAAGADTPWMFDPRPVSYIEELRDDLPDLDYSIASGMQIEGTL